MVLPLLLKCLPREQEKRGLNPAFFSYVIPLTSKLVLWCKVLGVAGSVLGLVGVVSVDRDWVRSQVLFAASVSVWQWVQVSEQIHLRYTVCMWLGP